MSMPRAPRGHLPSRPLMPAGFEWDMGDLLATPETRVERLLPASAALWRKRSKRSAMQS